ncbi:complement C1q domain-containing protein [Ferruginibacter sp. HRS2-29]|uniref:complement C1q domain-containing protein n=1 Tax=Ferruginibacter sp. HRS2-29 TaxID=2487334 RepID=UPI0020CFC821|nr:complement C1q domain-containing protein [Ferruginibacter sp. HRS2-29]MCP9751454.1 hypothetical protein [Ferruginibacter sp. HRS2-29]
MRKILPFVFSMLFVHGAMAQNVGVGTTSPLIPLHVRAASDTGVMLVENSTTMADGTNTALYFKNGTYYSGAIKTFGTGVNTSRLAFFGYANNGKNLLKEYMSISDDGNVGINNIIPQRKLDVAGLGRFVNADASLVMPAFLVTSASTGFGAPAIQATGAHAGIWGGSYSATGSGVIGFSGSVPTIYAGTGVLGTSGNGIGVMGYSQKSGSSSIYGYSEASDIVSGDFYNLANGRALRTNGKVQISGQGAAAGRVLTSDASGNATWQAIPTPAPATVAFSASLTSNVVINSNTGIAPNTYTAQYNDGGGFNAGSFTAPSAGIYSFTVNVGLSQPAFANALRIYVQLNVNGVTPPGCSHIGYLPPNSVGAHTITSSHILKLAAGDEVYVSFLSSAATGSTSTTINGGGGEYTTTFAGVKVN